MPMVLLSGAGFSQPPLPVLLCSCSRVTLTSSAIKGERTQVSVGCTNMTVHTPLGVKLEQRCCFITCVYTRNTSRDAASEYKRLILAPVLLGSWRQRQASPFSPSINATALSCQRSPPPLLLLVMLKEQTMPHIQGHTLPALLRFNPRVTANARCYTPARLSLGRL
ncbi:unnamed protein product [Pleuronectes platessa]|uniref:Uncharacterized protein n=1 Tax=Pleuronectes platessa TaxID=8262 RepID=A0A9N7Y2R8_PLEPL|nr:unnamed protein product [Pleuronectes platessa]